MTLIMIREIIVSLMLLGGSALMLLAGIGIIRFPCPLCRSHALAKASTLGICLMLGALWITLDDEISGLKLLLVMAFSLLTIPLAGHLVAKFAHGFESEVLPSEPPGNAAQDKDPNQSANGSDTGKYPSGSAQT